MIEVLTYPAVQEYTKSFEAERLTAYKCPAGIWTIAYGCTHPNGKPVYPGMICTHDEAIEWFLEEIKHCEEAISKMVAKQITRHQLSALVDMGYNLGTGGLAKSSVVNDLNMGCVQSAGEKLLTYNKAHVNGELVELPGLTKRCKYRYRIFNETDEAALAPLDLEIPTPEELAEIESAGIEKIQLESWNDMIKDFNNNLPQVPA